MSGLTERLRGEYRIPIKDGLGPAGGDEPDNANEFVRHFETPPIQHQAADLIDEMEKALREIAADGGERIDYVLSAQSAIAKLEELSK